jgi:hypothetical protein
MGLGASMTTPSSGISTCWSNPSSWSFSCSSSLVRGQWLKASKCNAITPVVGRQAYPDYVLRRHYDRVADQESGSPRLNYGCVRLVLQKRLLDLRAENGVPAM